MSCSPTHTVPPGRFAFFGCIPGNKLPGYDHPVPPGQSPVRPSGTTNLPDNCPQNRSHPIFRGRGRGGLACVPEDGEEVAGGSGGDEQMPDEMAIRELLGQVKSDPTGVSESAGGQPQ